MSMYTSERTREAMAETRRREALENPACGYSSPQQVNCLVLNGAPHCGTVVHVCGRPRDHAGQCACRDGCNHKFFKIG